MPLAVVTESILKIFLLNRIKNIKYLGKNLTKDMPDLYTKTIKYWWIKLKMV